MVIGIGGSARAGGNSERLLEEALGPVREAGIGAKVIFPRELRVEPCHGCEACRDTGRCVIRDGIHEVYEGILQAEALVVATPVYFGGLPAGFKALIDRAQYIYFRRLRRKEALPRGRCGALLVVSAADLPRQFESVRTQIGMWFGVLGFSLSFCEEFPGFDEAGEVERDRAALERARELGKRVAEVLVSG